MNKCCAGFHRKWNIWTDFTNMAYGITDINTLRICQDITGLTLTGVSEGRK